MDDALNKTIFILNLKTVVIFKKRLLNFRIFIFLLIITHFPWNVFSFYTHYTLLVPPYQPLSTGSGSILGAGELVASHLESALD